MQNEQTEVVDVIISGYSAGAPLIRVFMMPVLKGTLKN